MRSHVRAPSIVGTGSATWNPWPATVVKRSTSHCNDAALRRNRRTATAAPSIVADHTSLRWPPASGAPSCRPGHAPGGRSTSAPYRPRRDACTAANAQLVRCSAPGRAGDAQWADDALAGTGRWLADVEPSETLPMTGGAGWHTHRHASVPPASALRYRAGRAHQVPRRSPDRRCSTCGSTTRRTGPRTSRPSLPRTCARWRPPELSRIGDPYVANPGQFVGAPS